MFPIDFLIKAAAAYPDRIAVEGEGGSLTFAALLADADAVAAGLQDITGKTHPRVAVLSPNSLELLVALMAAHAGGCVLTPLNPRNAPVELDAQVAAAKPDVLVMDEQAAGKIGPFTGPVVRTRGAGPAPTIASLARGNAGRRPRWSHAEPGEVNAIKFTGGSSGRPKGVLQTFRNFNTVVASLQAAFCFEADDRYLVAAPMTHGAGMFLMPVLAAGGCCVVLDDLDASGIISALEHRRITTTWMPPTLLYMLLEQPGLDPSRFHLRHLVWGGAGAAPDRLRQAARAFGPVIEAVFGQTEASTIAAAIRAHEIDDEAMWQSVGRPTPLTRIAIAAPDGTLLGPDESGEILIRSDLVMKGYLDMPAETEAVLRNGWLHTGDVGYLDRRGYLFIRDRLRDVVISGGFNVYPSDVEAALARHPAVADAVVFGVPDPKWGERVEAAVQLRDGACVDEAELIGFAKTQVGSVKAPKHIHILDDLPKSPVGKVLRREVKALCAPGPLQR